MLDLSQDILSHLKCGGTLIVPSRQRASAVRVAYSAAMLGTGQRVWGSPDVLPWSAWIERGLDEARARGESLPRRLSVAEDWLLWQEAVQQACAAYQVLMPDAMIDPVRGAIALMDDYGLTPAALASAETTVLQQSREHFRRRCKELDVHSSASWPDCAKYLRPRAQLLLAGFASVGPKRRQWLELHQVGFAHATPTPSDTRMMDFDGPAQEAEAAAQWCAAALARDARARMLVVVPKLAEQRHLWERAFTQYLDQAQLFEGSYSSARSNYVIEGGRPLASYRLVAAALSLISIAAGAAQFDELTVILRSPFVSLPPRDDALRIDRWLREHNLDIASLPALRKLLPAVDRELHGTPGQGLRAFIEVLGVAAPAGHATAAQWAQRWAQLLQQCGWPGPDAISSDDQQVRVRLDELLGDFAAVTVPARRLTATEAYHRLRQMAQRTAFEPASDDVPVTITQQLEDPIVRYDGLWVAGLSADVWPPAARPDPLLPTALQYAAGLPAATASGQLELALQLQQHWQHRSRQCVLSWSRSFEDLPRDRSPLLPPAPSASGRLTEEWRSRHLSPEQWQIDHAPTLERWRDESAGPVAAGAALLGGTYLLELQSNCPFRAATELRLRATPLPQPVPGIDARVRGMILHEALERFWRSMRDQATLRASSPSDIEQLIHGCVTSAMQRVLAKEPGDIAPEMQRREQLRSEKLLRLLMPWELARPAFSTQILEGPLPVQWAGASLELRLDRVDRLDDGRLAIIDYKTGKPKPRFDLLGERLDQPQLPAYAIAAGPRSAAVATLYLGREGPKACGIADRANRISAIKPPKADEPQWPQLMQQWEQQLHQLVDEFLRGEAAVKPLPDACKYCHLQILCRIEPAAIPKLDEDADETEETDEDPA